jgi:hypothetical protein
VLCIMATMVLVADHRQVGICCLLHQMPVEVMGGLLSSSRFVVVVADGNMVPGWLLLWRVMYLLLLEKDIECLP